MTFTLNIALKVPEIMGAKENVVALIGDVNVASLIIFIVVLFLAYIFNRKQEGIPPGPKFTLPFIGDLPLLIGKDVTAIFRRLRQKHGDVISLYLGKDLVIVLSGYNVIHKAAVVKGNVFSGRPAILANDATGGKNGIIMAEGLLWKNQRRFTHGRLQQFGFGKSSFEAKILKEVDCFINVLKEEGGRPIDFRKYIHASVANVIFSIVCGKRHDYDDEHFQQLLIDTEITVINVLKVSVLLSFAPFLKYVPTDPLNMNLMRNNHLKWMKYFKKMYEEHFDNLHGNDANDFFDAYILEMSKGENPDFSVYQLSMIARDLFGAGAETTATTIRWAVLYLLKYKNIKARLQADIDGIIPSNRVPSLEDKAKLPYVEAFIMEVLRCANIAPLAVPHAVTNEDVVFHGYRIPKDTPILLNLDSVLTDADIFENPSQFNPERFLDSDGKVFRPKEFIPFGIGRRICLGEAVAKMELFLFLTAMIKQFDFVLPDGQSGPDMEGVLGITHAPKPFKVRFIPRTIS